MKITRVRLKDYRGISEREIRFEPVGVTVVEGPNEVGKSSIAEAIGRIFDVLDSATGGKVAPLKPVDRDVGTEVEIDVETGPYAFTYFKRFNKKKETALTVTRPKPGNLTGRAAHDEANKILDETIDKALWRALRVEQGEKVALADVRQMPSLMRALEAAAGSSEVSDHETGLFELVGAEYERYYGKNRKEKKVLTDAAGEVANLKDQVDELERAVAELDGEVRRAKQLDDAIAAARTGLAAAAPEAAELKAQLAHVEQLEQRCEQRNEDLARAKKDLEIAGEKLSARKEKAKLAEDFSAKFSDAERQVSELAEELASLADERDRRRDELDAARQRQAGARSLAKIRSDDYDVLRTADELIRMRERRDRVLRFESERSQLQEELERIRIDESLLEKIRDSDRSLAELRAKLEVASPVVRLEVHTDASVEIDGETVAPSAGETVSRRITSKMALDVPGVVSLEVTSGGGSEQVAREVDAEALRFDELCQTAGVAGVREAETAYQRRLEAERALADVEERLEADRRDLSAGELDDKVRREEKKVETYRSTRDPEPAIAADVGAAEELKRQAEAEQEAAIQDEAGCAAAEREALERHQECEKRRIECSAGQTALLERASALADQLTAERDELSDADLESEVVQCRKRAGEVAVAAEQLASEMRSANPDGVRAQATNADQKREKFARELSEAESDRREVKGRLETLGEKGLEEELDEAERRLAVAGRRNDDLRARAAAAKLLFDTMSDCHEEARRRYQGPLRDEIIRLGRIVFGSEFSVELDEGLAIKARTLDGKTVEFGSLSVGAQEQLSVIARLAVALMVAPDGGVPLIIDDALGYSDPERLARMGAVLNTAGETCQVIVLTCHPDRYASVGSARTVRIS